MRYSFISFILISALCLGGCGNTNKDRYEDICDDSLYVKSIHVSDSVHYTNVDTVFGHFLEKGIDTLLFEHTDSATWRLYNPSGKLVPLYLENAWGLYEGDLDGNGTDELGIRREQEMGNWQDYNIFTYHHGNWCYLIPSTVLLNSHFYDNLNQGQDAAEPANKKGYVHVYYSSFDDDCFLSDTIVKVSFIPIREQKQTKNCHYHKGITKDD